MLIFSYTQISLQKIGGSLPRSHPALQKAIKKQTNKQTNKKQNKTLLKKSNNLSPILHTTVDLNYAFTLFKKQLRNFKWSLSLE